MGLLRVAEYEPRIWQGSGRRTRRGIEQLQTNVVEGVSGIIAEYESGIIAYLHFLRRIDVRRVTRIPFAPGQSIDRVAWASQKPEHVVEGAVLKHQDNNMLNCLRHAKLLAACYHREVERLGVGKRGTRIWPQKFTGNLRRIGRYGCARSWVCLSLPS